MRMFFYGLIFLTALPLAACDNKKDAAADRIETAARKASDDIADAADDAVQTLNHTVIGLLPSQWQLEERTKENALLGRYADFLEQLMSAPVAAAEIVVGAAESSRLRPWEHPGQVISVALWTSFGNTEERAVAFLRSYFSDLQRLDTYYKRIEPYILHLLIRVGGLGTLHQWALESEAVLLSSFDPELGEMYPGWHTCVRYDQGCAGQPFPKKFTLAYGSDPSFVAAWPVAFLHRRYLEGGRESAKAWQAILLDLANRVNTEFKTK